MNNLHNLALAIAYEATFQRMNARGGWPVSRAWCMGSVAFLIGVRDHVMGRPS